MKDLLQRLRSASVPRRFAAVDFDSRRLRVVHAARSGRGVKVLGVYQGEMPSDLKRDDPAAMGQFLASALSKFGLSGTPVLMNVPRAQAVLKPIVLPEGIAEDELAGMVRFQVEKELPFRSEEAIIDYITSGPGAGSPDASAAGTHVLVAAVRLPVVDYYKNVCAAAGARLLRLGLRPASNLACVRACTFRDAGETLVLVHVGPDDTEIDIIVGQDLAFSRSASIRLDLSPGQSPDKAAEQVAVELVRTLQSYQAMQGTPSAPHLGDAAHGQASAVLVAGDTGIEEQLVRQITSRMRVRCEVLNAGAGFRLWEHQQSSGLVSVLGLAAAMPTPAAVFDFLEPKKPVIRRDKRQVRLVAASAAALVVVVALLVARAMYLADKNRTLRSIESQLSKQEDIFKKEVKPLRDRVDAIDSWVNYRTTFLPHVAYLSKILPSCQEVYVQTIEAGIEKPGNKVLKPEERAKEAVATINLTMRSPRDKVLTDQCPRSLLDAGYQVVPPSKAVNRNDPYGYGWEVSRFQLKIPRKGTPIDMSGVDLGKLRPEDDDSARRMGLPPPRYTSNSGAATPPQPAPVASAVQGGIEAPAQPSPSAGAGPGLHGQPMGPPVGHGSLGGPQPPRPDPSSGQPAGPEPVAVQPVPAQPQPSASPAGGVRVVGFETLKHDAQGVTSLSGDTVTIRGRVGQTDTQFLIQSAPQSDYVCYRLEDGGRDGNRYIYIYFKKGSPSLQEAQRRISRGDRFRNIRVQGSAYFLSGGPQQCPVGIIVDKLQ